MNISPAQYNKNAYLSREVRLQDRLRSVLLLKNKTEKRFVNHGCVEVSKAARWDVGEGRVVGGKAKVSVYIYALQLAVRGCVVCVDNKAAPKPTNTTYMP